MRALHQRQQTQEIHSATGIDEAQEQKDGKSAIKRILGKNVRMIRKSKNLSQEQLAFQLGTSPKHLGFIENGASFISAELLEKIAACLDIPPHMLFYSSSDKERHDDSELKRQAMISEIESIIDIELLQAYRNIKDKIKELR